MSPETRQQAREALGSMPERRVRRLAEKGGLWRDGQARDLPLPQLVDRMVDGFELSQFADLGLLALPLPGQLATPDQMTGHICSDYPSCPHGERCRAQPVGAEPSPVCFRQCTEEPVMLDSTTMTKAPADPIRDPIDAALETQGRSRYWLAQRVAESELCSADNVYRFLRGEGDVRLEVLGVILEVLGLEIRKARR